MKAYNKYEVDEIFSSWQSDLDQLDVIEVYTKSDIVAMFTEIQSQFEEKGCKDMRDCWWLLEERIDKLKEEQ